MPHSHATYLNWPIPDSAQSYTRRDTILYALGVGLGGDPVDPGQLSFLYEKGLRALPTLGLVVGSPGAWFADPQLGLDFSRLVNAGVSATFHAPMPVEGEVVGRNSVVSVADKGPERGLLLVTRRSLYSRPDDTHLCDIETTYLFRGDGQSVEAIGAPLARPHGIPDTAPDDIVSFGTLNQSALIYRLSGDLNPLHIDPEAARAAGFPRPILHGLCSLGIVAHMITTRLCAGDPARLRSLAARFVAPLFPGETIDLELWRRGEDVTFRARAKERDTIVLDNGRSLIDGNGG